MLQPEIKNVEIIDNEVRLSLFVHDKMTYFKGHFPDFQLLPGVVQIHWAIKFAIKYLACTEAFESMDAIKFVKPLRPNTLVRLSIFKDTEKNTISYLYEGEQGKYSSGRVKFK